MITIDRPDPEQLKNVFRLRMKYSPAEAGYVAEAVSAMFESVCMQAEHHLRTLEQRVAELERKVQ
jgi:hypothetical protein